MWLLDSENQIHPKTAKKMQTTNLLLTSVIISITLWILSAATELENFPYILNIFILHRGQILTLIVRFLYFYLPLYWNSYNYLPIWSSLSSQEFYKLNIATATVD